MKSDNPQGAEHTPTPWEARPTGQLFKDGILIGQFNSRWDAAIARDAVNNHTRLVNLLQEAIEMAEGEAISSERMGLRVYQRYFTECADRWRAALTAATATPQARETPPLHP